MNERLIKLLETASHPSTTDGERLNALSLFRRAADREGGIAKAFAPDFDMFRQQNEYTDKLNRDVTHLNRDVSRLTGERDTALQRLSELRTALTTLAKSEHATDPLDALHGALTSYWRTITELETAARQNGFTGHQGTLRNRADRLAQRGVIEVREAGDYANEHGGRYWHARSWRIKP